MAPVPASAALAAAPTLDAEGASGVRRDLREIVTDLRASRSLIYELTLRDIRVRYKQAVMGFAWAVLSPVLILAAGVVLRLVVMHLAKQPFAIGAVSGVLVKGLAWSFVAGAVNFSTTALTGNAPLIAKVYFPREVLPLAILLASAFDALIGSAALGLLLPFLGWQPTWAVLWTPVLALLLFGLTLAVGLVLSCANVFYRDVRYVAQLVVSFGIFFSPVFYDAGALGARWIVLQMLNPVAPILEGLRLAVVEGHGLLTPLVQADGGVVWSPWYLAYSAAWVVGGLLVGAVVFHRAHYRFAEYV